MPDIHTDESIDTLLRETFAARPEPRTNVDFAALVLANATVIEPPVIEPRVIEPRHSPAVWPVWLAVASVAAMVVLMAFRLTEAHAWRAADAAVSQAATNGTVSLLPIGGALFLITVVWVIARSALSDGERIDTLGTV